MEQHFSVDCTGNDDFPTFPKKRTTSRGITKFSKKISRKFSFHSTLLPEFLKFSVEWFAIRKFNSFRNFWKLFQEISVPFAAVSKFSKVLVEWKAPPISLDISLESILCGSVPDVIHPPPWTVIGNSTGVGGSPKLNF